MPVAVYLPAVTSHAPVIVFSHGYGLSDTSYSYLTGYLAEQGYFVASVQQDLPTDSAIPNTGIPQVVRRPFWERGADNILFVIGELQKRYPELDYKRIALIGHSNGGDMTALFPVKYPGVVERIITLDNRRMALPRMKGVYSLRSSDQVADEGVLPDSVTQGKFGMKIIKMADMPHNDMDDHANERQREEIRKWVMLFLSDKVRVLKNGGGR